MFISLKSKPMRRLRSLTLLFVWALFSGCSSYTTTSPTLHYSAYGEKWAYYYIDRYSSHVALISPHGFLGPVEEQYRSVFLIPEKGEPILVNERIYALQRDGTFRKVRCCDSVSTMANVYTFDNIMFIHFLQKPKEVTDCYVHPANQANYLSLPEDKRIEWVDFFGEFDLATMRFLVHDFFPGIDMTNDDHDKQWYAKASLEEFTKHSYTWRKPFNCNQ